MKIDIVRTGDDWDAVYLDGVLEVEGSFSILHYLEDLLFEGGTVEWLRVRSFNDKATFALEDGYAFPERFEEIDPSWFTD